MVHIVVHIWWLSSELPGNEILFIKSNILLQKKRTSSMARVRERTILTERQPLVGEVSANFCG
jgi:hypothetical protein